MGDNTQTRSGPSLAHYLAAEKAEVIIALAQDILTQKIQSPYTFEETERYVRMMNNKVLPAFYHILIFSIIKQAGRLDEFKEIVQASRYQAIYHLNILEKSYPNLADWQLLKQLWD